MFIEPRIDYSLPFIFVRSRIIGIEMSIAFLFGRINEYFFHIATFKYGTHSIRWPVALKPQSFDSVIFCRILNKTLS